MDWRDQRERAYMEDVLSPGPSSRGGSAEPIASYPPIDFESIEDPAALQALLKAREEKMRTLEKRIEIAQGAKNKIKERYTEKVEMLEQLVIALRRKLQTKVEEEGSASLGESNVDGKVATRIAELEKQNAGLKEMVAIQKQQVAAAKAESREVSTSVLSKMEEKVHELTAALQERSRECRAQAQLLEQKETKILELQSAIVNVQNNKSPDASGLSHKVQMLNSELKEARSMGTELKKQRDRFAAEYESLQSLVDRQREEKEELMRDHRCIYSPSNAAQSSAGGRLARAAPSCSGPEQLRAARVRGLRVNTAIAQRATWDFATLHTLPLPGMLLGPNNDIA